MSDIQILLIDDNPKFVTAATHFLTTVPGVAVVGCASSGIEGLTQVVNLQPDLVFMDVLMPNIDGFRLCMEIRRNHRLKSLPFIVYTSTYSSKDFSTTNVTNLTLAADGRCARDGQLANRALLLTLASQKAVNLQVGGGVRSLAVVDDLLRNGVDRVVVGSAAVEEPAAVAQWISQFGPERVCLAFDVRADDCGTPLVQTRGWTRATMPRSISARRPSSVRRMLPGWGSAWKNPSTRIWSR